MTTKRKVITILENMLFLTEFALSLLEVPSRCFSSFISVIRILYTFFCNTTTRFNQLDSNLANLGATVEVE